MKLSNPELMYEFHVKELTQTEALKQFADHIVKEIKSTTGWDTDVHVTIEPAVKDKHLFNVSMSVYGIGKTIVVSKMGKHVLAVLRKVRKAVLRQIHRLIDKKVGLRKKNILKDNLTKKFEDFYETFDEVAS